MQSTGRAIDVKPQDHVGGQQLNGLALMYVPVKCADLGYVHSLHLQEYGCVSR